MKAKKLFISFVATLATFFVACQQDDEVMPQNLPPQVELTRAYDITRHEAIIQGNVTPVGSGHICFVTLRYGVTDSLEHEVGFKNTERDITARLTNLQTATTYRCVLETGNEYSTISSDTLTFTTAQGGTPILSAITSYGRGPHRIGLQSSITDDGGLPILETGFYYWIAEGEKTKVTVAHHPDSLNMQRLIRLLEKDTPYQAQAYATNQLGEGVGPTFDFSVNDSLTLTMAGTLSEWLTLEEQHYMNSLTLSGPINSSDIYLIHCMAGGQYESNGLGRLAYLDLTEAHVRKGGTCPWGWNIGNDLAEGYIFQDCDQFVELRLPATLKYVQSYMFADCSNLQRLTFPRDMMVFEHNTNVFSEEVPNFSKLERFSISDDAPNFRVHNGALYNKSRTKLVWYPPMRDTARAYDFPSNLQEIGGGAFMGTKLKYLELPKEVHTLNNLMTVIYQNLEYLALPDSITSMTCSFTDMHTPNLITLYWGKGAKSIYEHLYTFSFPPTTLRNLYVPQSTPPSLSAPEYRGGISEIKDQCTLYVPIGASAAYRTDKEWGKFTHIVEVEF